VTRAGRLTRTLSVLANLRCTVHQQVNSRMFLRTRHHVYPLFHDMYSSIYRQVSKLTSRGQKSRSRVNMTTSPTTPLLPTTDSRSRKALSSTWNDFCDFALRDNVLEVAVGLILAAAFSTVVSSFVSDILLPPISLLPFLSRNLDERFATLKQGGNGTAGYNTVQLALDDGAVVMAYG
jgi:hypothetical protein